MFAWIRAAAQLRRTQWLALAALLALGAVTAPTTAMAITIEEKKAAERAALRKWADYYYQQKQREKKDAEKRAEQKAEMKRLEQKQRDKKEQERLDYLRQERKAAEKKAQEKRDYQKAEQRRYDRKREEQRVEQKRADSRQAEWQARKTKIIHCKTHYRGSRVEKTCGVL